MSDQTKINEDYRKVALYKNAQAVMVSIDAQAARINDMLIERDKDRQQVAMLRQELRILTQRFNEQFVLLTGNGATDGDVD
jgi:hypothetical protein